VDSCVSNSLKIRLNYPSTSSLYERKRAVLLQKSFDQTSASAFPIQVKIPKQKNTQKEMNWVFASDHDLIEVD